MGYRLDLFLLLYLSRQFLLALKHILVSRCTLLHPESAMLEKWISTKDYPGDETLMAPKWHIPSDEEVQFANELLNIHIQSALDDLLKICQTKMHSDPGDSFFWFSVQILYFYRGREFPALKNFT